MTGLWERKRRPYNLWQVGVDGSFTAPRWSEFTQGSSLLLIHGTFSTPQVGFTGWLDQPTFEAVAARYGGRVLAFAHPSLSASPQENIDWLVQHLPAGEAFGGALDVLCHSRGGLLARELAARGAAGAGPRVDRICQVGAPNLGTPLADATRWTAFLDSHTNCLTVLPDTTTTIVLEGLLCLVKIIGTGVARGLPGLAAMEPAGDWVRTFGSRPTGDARWFTIGASYKPSSPIAAGLVHRLGSAVADAAVDEFFAADNDMVVPTEGCHWPGTPALDSLHLKGSVTNHCNYFESHEVHEALSRWLG